MTNTYQDYFDTLGFRESSSIPGGAQNYRTENAHGFIGKYQFGEAALFDLGYYGIDKSDSNLFKNDWIGNWSGKGKINSKQDYFDNGPVQETIIHDWHDILWGRIKFLGLEKYEGQILNGVQITTSGMLAASHLIGTGSNSSDVAGLKGYLLSGAVYSPKDGNGTTANEYMTSFEGFQTPFIVDHSKAETIAGGTGSDVLTGFQGDDSLIGSAGDDVLNGGPGFDVAIQEGRLTDYQIKILVDGISLIHHNGTIDFFTDIESIRFAAGTSLAIAHSKNEAVAHHLTTTWLGRDLTAIEGRAVQSLQGENVNDIVQAFLNLPEAIDLRSKTVDELLAGLSNNSNIIKPGVKGEYIGSNDNDQGAVRLEFGLVFNIDGGAGVDILNIHNARDDVQLEMAGDVLKITHLQNDGMLSLKNVDVITFASGENVILAHNQVEGILGRLFRSFFDRDATAEQWQLGREALAAEISPVIMLKWFQDQAGLNSLSDINFIQTIYYQTVGREATEIEINHHLTQLSDGQINREWIAVEVASSEEAIAVVGNVIVREDWV